MALTETEKDWIKEHVENASIAAAERIIKEVMIAHIKSCPHGQRMIRMIFMIVGISLGSGFAGSGLAFGIIKLIMSSAGG